MLRVKNLSNKGHGYKVMLLMPWILVGAFLVMVLLNEKVITEVQAYSFKSLQNIYLVSSERCANIGVDLERLDENRIEAARREEVCFQRVRELQNKQASLETINTKRRVCSYLSKRKSDVEAAINTLLAQKYELGCN